MCAADAQIGEFLVIGPQPSSGDLLHLLDGFKIVKVQTFMPDCPVVALHIGVLLGLARLDVGQGDALYRYLEPSRFLSTRPRIVKKITAPATSVGVKNTKIRIATPAPG